MIKIVGLVFLALCFCSPGLHAQEVAGQGWAASESRPRSSSTISLAVTGSTRDPAHPSSETFVSAVIPNGNGKDRMSPFPVLTPKVISYPRKAIRKGWEGQTVVVAEILPDGSVGRMTLAKTSGHEVLDHAAQDGIKTWKFATESENDVAVPQYVDIPVTFKLEEQKE